MLFNGYDIAISFAMQQFQCNCVHIFVEKGEEKEFAFDFHSTLATETVKCPYCGGSVHICGHYSTELRDVPLYPGTRQSAAVSFHRYRCQNCGKSFSEDICMKHPGTRITERAANWIRTLLLHHLSISAVQQITGIHWDTIRQIHSEIMEIELEKRRVELKNAGYKPKYLAVDEFAIHKGHTYATCVMDLELGDALWVGHGRSMDAFMNFFREFDLEYLSDVKAVAMDMNASYNRLVESYLPQAEIVYDRYHMQAQYGKDVLGAVRLAEAKTHKTRAEEMQTSADKSKDPAERKALREEARKEKQQYTELKRARWTLLTNGNRLHREGAASLKQILDAHNDLSICYAMKEELCDLFELRDPVEAERRWKSWFEGAKASGIEPLVKFARLKEKRLKGLVAHAAHPISTGKLEGLNNKIKVCKRIGYGYRNDNYFFTLVRYISLPSSKLKSPNFP